MAKMKVVLITEAGGLPGTLGGEFTQFPLDFKLALPNLTPALLARPRRTPSLRYPNMNLSLVKR